MNKKTLIKYHIFPRCQYIINYSKKYYWCNCQMTPNPWLEYPGIPGIPGIPSKKFSTEATTPKNSDSRTS